MKFAEQQLVYTLDEPVDHKTTDSTKAEDKLPQKISQMLHANTKSTTLSVMWAKAIMLDSSCAGTAIYLQTIGASLLRPLSNTSLLAIGVQ